MTPKIQIALDTLDPNHALELARLAEVDMTGVEDPVARSREVQAIGVNFSKSRKLKR